MKILMVNKFLYPKGGSETYIFRLGRQLENMGHQVQYFGMEHEGRCVGNNAEQYTQDMDFHNAGVIEKLTYPLKTIYSGDAKKKMKIVLNDFQPDVVHLNNFNYQLTPSIIFAVKEYEKQSGRAVKLVYTAHDYQLICPNHMLFNNNKVCESCIGGNFKECAKGKCIHSSAAKSIIGAIEGYYWKAKNAYKYIDTVICPTRFMKNMLDTNPVFKDKTTVMLNFTQKKTAESVNKEDYVLYFGRFDEEKGVKLFESLDGIKLICAGTGNLEDYISSLPNAENVGFKSGDELETLVKNAACSVYPSLWYENCPFSIMESIMLGTPVVASDIGGIPELVENGKTGYLFEAGNAQQLCEKIKLILSDKEATQKMSKACLETEFDSDEEYAQKLVELYKA